MNLVMSSSCIDEVSVVLCLVMGIGHIFKIDDCYINIDQWSIIGDDYLLSLFTDYNYSDSLYFKSMLDKNKDLNKIISYFYKL
jgi:hypothetical protein